MKFFFPIIVIALLNFFLSVSSLPMWQLPPAKKADANPALINGVIANPGDIFTILPFRSEGGKRHSAIFVRQEKEWFIFATLCPFGDLHFPPEELEKKVPGISEELKRFSVEKGLQPDDKYIPIELRAVIPKFPDAFGMSMDIESKVSRLEGSLGELVVKYLEVNNVQVRHSDVVFIEKHWDEFSRRAGQHTTAGTSSGSGSGSSSVAVHLPVQPPSGFQFIAENWDESTRQMGQDIRAGTFSGSGPGSSSAVVHLPIQPPSVSHSTLPPSPNQRPRHREKHRHRPYPPGNPTVDIPNPNPGSVGIIQGGLPHVSSGPSSRSSRAGRHPPQAPTPQLPYHPPYHPPGAEPHAPPTFQPQYSYPDYLHSGAGPAHATTSQPQSDYPPPGSVHATTFQPQQLYSPPKHPHPGAILTHAQPQFSYAPSELPHYSGQGPTGGAVAPENQGSEGDRQILKYLGLLP